MVYTRTLTAIFLSILMYAPLQAMGGNIRAGEVVLRSRYMTEDGGTTSGKRIKILCDESFNGHGYLKAPEIKIVTKKFEFTGIIECEAQCTIITQEPFDATMLERRGTGEFIITIGNIEEELQQHDAEHQRALELAFRTGNIAEKMQQHIAERQRALESASDKIEKEMREAFAKHRKALALAFQKGF